MSLYKQCSMHMMTDAQKAKTKNYNGGVENRVMQ